MTVLQVRSIVIASVAFGGFGLPLTAAPPTQAAPRRPALPPSIAVPLPRTTPRITIPPQSQSSPPNRTLPQFQLPQRTLPKITLPQTPPRTLPPLSNGAGRAGSPPARNPGVTPQAPGGLGRNGIAINQIPGGLQRGPRDLGDQARDALLERERMGNVADPQGPRERNWAGPLPWDWGQADPGNPADPAPPPGPGVEAGPTPWDWVAIGLSAAALLRANENHGGVVGYPIVCPSPVITVPAADVEPAAGASVPESNPTEAAAIGKPTTVEKAPRLETGKSFELPGRGFGEEVGRVAVKIGPVFAECRVENWSDTSFRATIPPIVLEAEAKAELIAAKANGSPLTRLEILLVPASHPSHIEE